MEIDKWLRIREIQRDRMYNVELIYKKLVTYR